MKNGKPKEHLNFTSAINNTMLFELDKYYHDEVVDLILENSDEEQAITNSASTKDELKDIENALKNGSITPSEAIEIFGYDVIDQLIASAENSPIVEEIIPVAVQAGCGIDRNIINHYLDNSGLDFKV
ncbi:MAG: hypothetical protein N4A47_00605 [Clostridia bacterium]|jgi:hypothetical protein|nr:hypothetical protein [Clostridia bacterium]